MALDGTIHEAVVDGVRCLWVDAPRPFTAVLAFRVGTVDEAMRSKGISHLAEHLALEPFFDRDWDIEVNGVVAPMVTSFLGVGDPRQVGEYLHDLCLVLHDLPYHRIDIEAGVLAQEEAMTTGAVGWRIAQAYFGLQGLGHSAWPQYGLHWLGQPHLEAWVAKYFTKDNAILYLTGPPPADWTLPLPPGEPQPIPGFDRSATPAPEEPTLLELQQQGATWGALLSEPVDVSNRIVRGMVNVMTRRLHSRLRSDLGRVYHVGADVQRLDRELLFMTLGVDARPEHAREVGVEFLEVLESFAADGPTPEEVAREARRFRQWNQDHPEESLRQLVQASANARLAGWDGPRSVESVIESMAALDPEEMRARFAEAFRQSYMVADLPLDSLGYMPQSPYTVLDDQPGQPEPFRTFRRKPKHLKRRTAQVLRVGPSGVSAREDRDAFWIYVPLDDIVLVIVDGPAAAAFAHHVNIWIDSRDYFGSKALIEAVEAWPVEKRLPITRALA